jgi:hypothetical protein
MARRQSHGPVSAGRRAGRLVAATAGSAILLAGAVAALSVAPAAASPGRASASGGRAAARAVAAPEHDSPTGFWYGTDSRQVTISGSAPYLVPVIGGHYGGYIGMTGNWANLEDCHKIVVWSATNSAQANADYAQHLGVGTGVYYFMGGPGVDPDYNGTTSEAAA